MACKGAAGCSVVAPRILVAHEQPLRRMGSDRRLLALLRSLQGAFVILALIMTLPMGLNWTGDMYDMPIAREFSTEKRQTDEEREMLRGEAVEAEPAKARL